jgi:iron-sulfur cluster repair protein YtfE (RIC family)
MSGDDQNPQAAGPPRGRFTIVYLIHDAFRRDLARLSAALRSPQVDLTRARQLTAHWEFVNDQLHHHHRIEDESLWPVVRPKLAGHDEQLGVLGDMEAQHLALASQDDAVAEGFAVYAARPEAKAGVVLAGQLDELGVELATHLDDEETRCFPVIDQAMTDAEFESFGKATAKAIGMRGSARFFPWIFDGADPRERKAVLSMPPPPVRVLCTYVWEPRYRRQTAELWAR